MSLHKYFKPSVEKRNSAITDAIPVAATVAELTANERREVTEAVANVVASKVAKRKIPHKKYDDKKRAEVAAYALTNGCRSAERRYGITESTIRGFMKSYKEKVASGMDQDMTSLPKQKRGRKPLLPEEIDNKVMGMVASMRLAGAVVNYNILIAVARGIIIANDRTILSQYGGTVQLGYRWCQSIFARMKWTKRKATTAKPTIAPGLIKEVGLTFFKDIAEIVQCLEIPPELIINIDQTPIPYILISKYTMNQKNAKHVPIQGTADYRQITGTFGVTMSGNFLPIQLIYQGKTDRCHPQFTFPTEFHITHTENHWANEKTSLDLLDKILTPYVVKTREDLGLSQNHPWLLIADVFKGQWTDPVKENVRGSHGKMVAVPNNWTSYFQPLDVSVNKPCKDFIRNEAQTWYSGKIIEQLDAGKQSHEVKVEVQISILKPLMAKWVTKWYDYIRSKPEIVRNGWEKSQIMKHVHEKIELDPFID